ncbi:MAG TPA: hypothetical protein VIO39_03780 [Methylotenera sp.]
MNSEHLTVEIEGRKALPVRAIPYVTGWGVGELVQYFSRKVGAPFERLQEVYAYHLLSGQPIKYLPREWDGVQINLDALSAELHEKFKNDDQGYAAWCSEAVAALPEGLFVWLDEFEKDCAVNLSPNRIIFPKERDGDRELNYTPNLNTANLEKVLAGFDEFNVKKINQHETHKLGALEVSEVTKSINQVESFKNTKWTNEKLEELYQFYINEKNLKKTRAFKKATAIHYGITTKRVEQLLKKRESNKPNPFGLKVQQLIKSS